MKVVAINSVNFGSTGNIMCKISDTANESGIYSVVSYPKSNENKRKVIKDSIIIGNRISRNLHIKFAEFTGYQGCFSYLSTLNFLHNLEKINPDIIHLHNLHNCYINLPMLFKYVKKHNIRIVWTLHDCWAFTGQCPYFTIAKCDKWKKGCHDCVQYNSEYPVTRIDKTNKMWKLKKKWFTDINNLDIITPSKWLAGLVKESFYVNIMLM